MIEGVCIGFLLGAIVCLVFVGIGVCFGRADKGTDKGELCDDTDIRVYIPVRRRGGCGDNGSDLPTRQEVENVLRTLRMSACWTEKRVLDYLLDNICGGQDD